MDLQYDGTGLHGWAKQAGLPTVEGVWRMLLRGCWVRPRRYELRVAQTRVCMPVCRWRTCTCLTVSTGPAAGFAECFDPAWYSRLADCAATADFDARRDATGRGYRYYVWTGAVPSPFWSRYCWHVPGGLHLEGLERAAAAVVGRHDFTAFTPTETEHVFFRRMVTRCVWRRAAGFPGAPPAVADGRARIKSGAGMLYLEVEAEAFLRHMVRILVGTMLEVAQDRRGLDDLIRLLQGAAREEAGPTAPAQGLF